MEEYWFLAPMSRLAISSDSLKFFSETLHDNLPIAEAKQLGNLSKLRLQRQRERRQTKGVMSRTMAVHVCYKSLYIALPFSTKQQREMIKFCVFWRTYATTANILDFLMELIAGTTYLIWAGF